MRECDVLQCHHYMAVLYVRAFMLLCVIVPTLVHLKEQRSSEYKVSETLIIIA